MQNRTLLLLFLALIILACIELFYLLFNKGLTANKLYKNLNSPIAGKYYTNTTHINSTAANSLNGFDSHILSKVMATAEFDGEISEVLDKPGVKENMHYTKALALKPKTTNRISNYLFFRYKDISKIKVHMDGSDVAKSFSDLKVGDEVRIVENIDLLSKSFSNIDSVDISIK